MTGVAGPGSELEKARERLNVSRREVADALNLPIRVIEALETDDYERLPPSVFTRGYLRSYARLLELDPAAVTATYPLAEPAAEASEIDAPRPSGPRTGAIALIAGIALLIVVIVVVVAVVSGGGDASSSPPRASPGSEIGEHPVPMESEATATIAETVEFVDAADVEAPAPEDASEPGFDARVEPVEPAAATGMRDGEALEAPDEVVDVEIDDEDERDVSRVPAAAPEGARSTPPVATAVEGDADDVGPGDAAASDSRRITELGDDVLELSFSDDCWVEVKTVEGESLYSNLNRSGRTIRLVGRGPFRVLLGYAPGVALSYNGERVPLNRYTRNNVASLVVGR